MLKNKYGIILILICISMKLLKNTIFEENNIEMKILNKYNITNTVCNIEYTKEVNSKTKGLY